MKVSIELSKEHLQSIPSKVLRQILIDIGIWDKNDLRDPSEDLLAAWDLLNKMTNDFGQGIKLEMGVTDALNGYGRLETWYAIYHEYTETCKLCVTYPDHSGNCSWDREWKALFSERGFSVTEAICRLAIRYKYEEVEKSQ